MDMGSILRLPMAPVLKSHLGDGKSKTQATQLETGVTSNSNDLPGPTDGPLGFSQVSPNVPLLGANLSDTFSWLRYVPDRLRRRLTPSLAPGDFAPAQF